MIYNVRHLTTYSYEAPVSFGRCALRLTPRGAPDQTVFASDITITPTPSRVERHIGQFGEQVTTAIIETPHRELKIDARSRVEVDRPQRLPGFQGAPWGAVREAAFAIDSLDLTSPVHFLYTTKRTPLVGSITDYCRDSFAPGRPVIEAAFDLACRIRRDFKYDPDATEVRTPASEAFAARRGVCQDFAHIMIAGLRGIGLPAAYVSGYLRTFPPPGQARLEGADATHAWVDLWCGGDGWIGFDPTNALIVADHHIILAVGRDYSDIAPIGGVVLGPGDQKIKVAVDVAPVA